MFFDLERDNNNKKIYKKNLKLKLKKYKKINEILAVFNKCYNGIKNV